MGANASEQNAKENADQEAADAQVAAAAGADNADNAIANAQKTKKLPPPPAGYGKQAKKVEDLGGGLISFETDKEYPYGPNGPAVMKFYFWDTKTQSWTLTRTVVEWPGSEIFIRINHETGTTTVVSDGKSIVYNGKPTEIPPQPGDPGRPPNARPPAGKPPVPAGETGPRVEGDAHQEKDPWGNPDGTVYEFTIKNGDGQVTLHFSIKVGADGNIEEYGWSVGIPLSGPVKMPKEPPARIILPNPPEWLNIPPPGSWFTGGGF